MKESSKKFEKNEPEEGWKIGMDFQFCGSSATAPGPAGKNRQLSGHMHGKITRIGGSIKDLEAVFTFPDGFTTKLWLNFDEIEPLKNKPEIAKENSPHSKAA